MASQGGGGCAPFGEGGGGLTAADKIGSRGCEAGKYFAAVLRGRDDVADCEDECAAHLNLLRGMGKPVGIGWSW